VDVEASAAQSSGSGQAGEPSARDENFRH
jgi:hypothetical protein